MNGRDNYRKVFKHTVINLSVLENVLSLFQHFEKLWQRSEKRVKKLLRVKKTDIFVEISLRKKNLEKPV